MCLLFVCLGAFCLFLSRRMKNCHNKENFINRMTKINFFQLYLIL